MPELLNPFQFPWSLAQWSNWDRVRLFSLYIFVSIFDVNCQLIRTKEYKTTIISVCNLGLKDNNHEIDRILQIMRQQLFSSDLLVTDSQK